MVDRHLSFFVKLISKQNQRDFLFQRKRTKKDAVAIIAFGGHLGGASRNIYRAQHRKGSVLFLACSKILFRILSGATHPYWRCLRFGRLLVRRKLFILRWAEYLWSSENRNRSPCFGSFFWHNSMFSWATCPPNSKEFFYSYFWAGGEHSLVFD